MKTEHRRHHRDERGEYLIVSGKAEDVDEAIEMRDALEDGDEPSGYHYWMGKAQQSDRGRRGLYEVWFRKTVKGRRLR